jgi:hypothetical protein
VSSILVDQYDGIRAVGTERVSVGVKRLPLQRREPEHTFAIVMQYELDESVTKPTLAVVKDQRACDRRTSFVEPGDQGIPFRPRGCLAVRSRSRMAIRNETLTRYDLSHSIMTERQ